MKFTLFALIGLSTFLAAGCGGGGSPKNAPTPTPSPTASPNPTDPAPGEAVATALSVEGALPERPESAEIALRLATTGGAAVAAALVAISLDGKALKPVTTDDDGGGTVSLTAAQLSVGSHSLVLTYAGDRDHQKTNKSLTMKIQNGPARAATKIDGPDAFDLPVGGSGTIGVKLFAESGEPIAGGEIELEGVPSELATVITSATGAARFALSGIEPGSYAIAFAFGGDSRHAPSRKSATLRVARSVTPSEVTLAAPESLSIGGRAAAVASVKAGGAPVAGAAVRIQVFGASGAMVEGSGQTDGGGRFSLAVDATEGMGVGGWRAVATYAGTPEISAGTDTADFAVGRGATSATVGGTPSPVPYGGTINFGGQLTGGGGRFGLGGRTLRFVDSGGATLTTGTTDGNGSAAGAYHVTWAPGTYAVTGAFDGDAAFEGTSSGELTVTVTKCDTSYTVRDASGRRSETVPLHCWVKRATDGAPVVGVPVKFYLGNEYLKTDNTNSSGYAAISLPLAGRSVGTRTIRTTFAGDDRHKSGEGQATLTIRA